MKESATSFWVITKGVGDCDGHVVVETEEEEAETVAAEKEENVLLERVRIGEKRDLSLCLVTCFNGSMLDLDWVIGMD